VWTIMLLSQLVMRVQELAVALFRSVPNNFKFHDIQKSRFYAAFFLSSVFEC
jgi:hypothetical protein